jgi:TolA-binding protein
MTTRARAAVLVLTAALLGAACAARSSPPPPPVAPRAAAEPQVIAPAAEPARASEDTARILAELADLQNAVARLVAESRRQDDHLAGLERRLTELERRPAAGDVPPGFAPSGVGAAAPSSAPAPGTMSSAADLYASGMARVRDRDYDTAILVLSELVSNYPTHPLRESAQLAVADIYYLQRDYRGAVAEFERLLAAVPRGAKTPEIWVKIGLSRRGLGDEAGAREAWQRVIGEHGQTDAARQARDLLRTSPRS